MRTWGIATKGTFRGDSDNNCLVRCDRTPDPTAKGTSGSRPRLDRAVNPYYSVWEFGYHRCGFGKDKCLFQVTLRDRSTTVTSYHATCCYPDDLMTDYDGALWRYFEHLKSFFELLDLTLGVSVYLNGWTRTGPDIDSGGWPNPRWTGASCFPWVV